MSLSMYSLQGSGIYVEEDTKWSSGPKGLDDCKEIVSSINDRDEIHMNSQRLWQQAEVLHKLTSSSDKGMWTQFYF